MTGRTPGIMFQVAIALVPGIGAMAFFFGSGILINVVIGIAAALATETAVLAIRREPLTPLGDSSAIVTGMLIGICLPPLVPLWIVVTGVVFGLTLGKHIYGGLGHNPFNPAMVGYSVLIIAFPLAMTLWPAPGSALTITDVIAYKLGATVADGITAATPLDAFKFRGSTTVDEFLSTSPAMAALAGKGWQWINAAFLAGGVFLLYRRICHWLMPAVFLTTLIALSALFYDGGSSSSLGSPVFHLFSGATMLAAFFILTDPVTAPTGTSAQIIFAIGVAILTFIIRNIGAYPDGIAFAILLMNTATPFMDQLRWRFA